MCIVTRYYIVTTVIEYDHADDFPSVFITKRRESYRGIHVPLDQACILRVYLFI